jgi:hypothetical protein
VAEGGVLGDGLNRSPEFPLRTVSSCPGRNRRSGTWFDTRLCPGDAPRDGTTPSNSEEAWYGPGLPEYRRVSSAAVRSEDSLRAAWWQRRMVASGGWSRSRRALYRRPRASIRAGNRRIEVEEWRVTVSNSARDFRSEVDDD